MRRNMDLIRQLLLGIEGEASTQHEFRIEGVDDLEKWYNIDLLVQANLIRGCRSSLGSRWHGTICLYQGTCSIDMGRP